MTNIGSVHFDDIFSDMDQELKKKARMFISEQEYRDYLSKMTCEQLKIYDSSGDRVPGEKQSIYNYMVRIKCNQKKADQNAIDFAVNYISKVADELDKDGFIEIADILDEAIQKFAKLYNCKDC